MPRCKRCGRRIKSGKYGPKCQRMAQIRQPEQLEINFNSPIDRRTSMLEQYKAVQGVLNRKL